MEVNNMVVIVVAGGICYVVTEIQYTMFMEAAEKRIIDDIKEVLEEQVDKISRMEEVARKLETNG